MLRNTFCHLPGVSARTERAWWAAGVREWGHVYAENAGGISRKRWLTVVPLLEESTRRLERGDAAYFSGLLAPREQWRLFGDFGARAAYLDIETTGLRGSESIITAIAVYDGRQVRTYVHGRNMDDFAREIGQYDLLVTYNGKTFDLPFIERALGVRLGMAHIDLRYALSSLGFKGGLKAVEKSFGMERGDLEGVDGYLAVLLWREYERTRQESVLETLLAYNAQDVLNLEELMVRAYNLHLAETPFAESRRLEMRTTAPNPYRPDRVVIQKCLGAWRGW